MAADRRRALWAAAATLAVAAGLAAALVHLGPPSERRQLRLDVRRVSSLMSLESDLGTFLNKEGTLPPELSALAGKPWASAVDVDPVTRAAFGYEVVGPRTYRLCADFDRPTPSPRTYREKDFWNHPQGRHCYQIEVEAKELSECDSTGLGIPPTPRAPKHARQHRNTQLREGPRGLSAAAPARV